MADKVTNSTCYVERSKVREILIASEADNESTRAILQEVDALPIFTAGDFREAAYHECADIATKYNDCGGNFIAEKIRDAATALYTTGQPKP